ncbi:MAG: hypothetical protein ACPHKY_07275 [Acidimicrobiales bacterium]
MCGILGVVSTKDNHLTSQDVKLLVGVGRKAQRRGVDASGLVLMESDHNFQIVKANHGFGTMIRTREGRELLRRARNGDTYSLFGHSRLETHGYSGASNNNQPVVIGNWVVVHNGVITNAPYLRSEIAIDDLGIETDTAVIALLLQEWEQNGRRDSIDQVFEKLQGEYTVIAASTSGEILCRTNVGNLYSTETKTGNVLLASEPRQFPDKLLDNCKQIKLNTTITLRSRSERDGRISINNVRRKELGMEGAQGLHLKKGQLDSGFSYTMTTIAKNAQEQALRLKRCTKCVLPDTFPGIIFDSNGTCSVCNDFKLPKYPGIEKFVTDLKESLPSNKKVLVCLSGGRDSSYILHLTHSLGFTPIAYTYDWGMVTTAARENMSRMCGDLGVEHIVVSPDIRKNRTRIKRALIAWLKNPKLETIPILMAGDKPYFRWARKVAHERGNLPVLLADHPMETTGFKAMLAGANPSLDHAQGSSYRLGLTNMGRMVFAYGSHAIQSPGLIPSLAQEGLTGFIDYYVRGHKDFLRPFSYIPWEEEKIENILRSEYEWSSGEDRSVTSWRMGDGTAPFYNLMYLIGLGMTEHDTLRSNQIRFGLMKRSEAISRIRQDNSFNALGLASYFATVGINLNWAGDQIQRFARSYE